MITNKLALFIIFICALTGPTAILLDNLIVKKPVNVIEIKKIEKVIPISRKCTDGMCYIRVEVRGFINPDTSKMLRAALTMVEERDSAVVIVIDSGGGMVNSALEMINAINKSKVPVHCVVDRLAGSSAFFLLQSCSTRTMTYASRLLLHEAYVSVESGSSLKIKDLNNIIAHLKEQNRTLMRFCSLKMHRSPKELQDRISGVDWWMDFLEARLEGAIDQVSDTVEHSIAIATRNQR